MAKSLLICLIFLLMAERVISQSTYNNSPSVLMALIKKSMSDTNRIKLQLQLGSYYVFKPGEFKSDLDSALSFFNPALQLSIAINSIKWQNETLKLIGDCYLEGGNFRQGELAFMQVIDYYHKTGDKKKEGFTWLRLGDCIQGDHGTYTEKINSYERARSLFQELKDKLDETETLKKIGDAHLNEGKLDLAESVLLQVVSQFKALHDNHGIYLTYDLLGAVEENKGDLAKELFYRTEAVKGVEASDNTRILGYFYYKLADTYITLGEYDKSKLYYHKSLTLSKKALNFNLLYVDACAISRLMIRERQPLQALKFLQKISNEAAPKDDDQKYVLYRAIGQCYQALKQYDKAEFNYLKMIRLIDNTNASFQSEGNLGEYEVICNFYIFTRQFQKAGYYVSRLMSLPKAATGRALYVKSIALLQFKVDSGQGNYLSAINHFEQYKIITDSLFNVTKSKQIENLEITNETIQKERSIAVLQNQGETQRTQLRKVNQQKNITLAGVGLLLFIAGTIYYGYWQKQRSNLKLKQLQYETDQQNLVLQGLNEKLGVLNLNQKTLLIEKELLLREIHHRVKNNLQTTMSLLNMQSSYISNNEALEAIRNSQRRMHAMSLIHQKLYQSNNLTSINMDIYIHELVNYLQESFKGTGNINFKIQTLPIQLDVAQAVPLGLIVNEAITNAIKYAFPKGKKGVLTIGLNETETKRYKLTISDNGIGLPDCFDIVNSNSLGIKLMKGLSDQLQADFQIITYHGTCVVIDFEYSQILREELAALKEVLV